MATAAELRRLYNGGEFFNCLTAVRAELNGRRQDDPERPELLALGGWCFYRQEDYETARGYFQRARQVGFALEGLAYLAAYVDKDDETLNRLITELGDRVNVQNALTIRARDADSNITHEQVKEGALRFQGDTSVEGANLWHNAGRFFYAKSRDEQDLIEALYFLDGAVARYGTEGNWHHRGAVNYWRSRVLEDRGENRDALLMAYQSLYCWGEQFFLDPFTDRHRVQLENAVKRVRELTS